MPEPVGGGAGAARLPGGGHALAAGQLLSTALDEVSHGRLEAAQQMLDEHAPLGVSLGDVFRAYQAELETRAQQLADGQRRLERALDWFAHLHRSLPVAALLVDAQGIVVDANACAVDQFELGPALRSVRLPLRRLLARPEDEVALTRLRMRLGETDHAALDDLALRTLGGQPRWADLRVSRLPAADAPWGLDQGQGGQLDLFVLTDRTARVEAQHAREAAEAADQKRLQAEAASRAKTDLLGRVSHELRTPLNAVLGFAHLLLLPEAGMPPDARRRLGLIQQAGQHLLSLVDEVLEINRAEAGALALDMHPVDLLALARDVLAMHEPLASDLSLNLSVERAADAPPLPPALADSRRTWEILVNLVSNAVKYNRRGGWVRVRAGVEPETLREPGRVWIEVADSGIGMSAEQCAHLFEPFNRLGAERLGVSGHGLGLSIARAYALAMGGDLTVQSVSGEGSCLRLRLPRGAS
ncbi:HAMP domain-containing sensor histidine kinase [Ideonella sp. DXS22W]|uniref:histidine kinase n=1 Tax=Pseudaquabacterium inlustre TaxID=2984192 RepID=A0ABU9CCL2_9BURK